MTQLPLPIHQLDDTTFKNFYSDNNPLLLAAVHKNFPQLQQPFIYIWGGEGTGKTHFLKACVHEWQQAEQSAIYIPLSKSRYFPPAVLDNLEQNQLVCLDDLQCVMGDDEWEVAIFNLINRIKASKKTLLLMTANVAPKALPVELPDLASRLSWGEQYQLSQLSEEQKRQVLQENARQRGMELTDETANFLLKRVDRNLKSLLQTLTVLDTASLQAQRKLTIPFVKEVLGL